MPFSWLNLEIALAHLFHRRRQTIVSVLGVALGVGFFIGTSSLMSGSEQDFTDRLVNSQPHITIKDEFREAPLQPVYRAYTEGAVELRDVEPREYLRGIKNYKGKLAELRRREGIVAGPTLTGQAIIRYGGRDRSVTVLGIDPDVEPLLTDIAEDMREGGFQQLKTTADGIIIGYGLSKRLSLGMGDLATVTSPQGLVRRVKVAGIFRTGSLLQDEGQSYVLLKDAQILLGKPNIANQIRIKLTDPNAAIGVAAQLEQRWRYRSESWQELSEDILGLFVIRNAILYSIVSAIMVVAAFGIFNIISTVVMEKRRDIAIMMSMGFKARDIRRIFLLQGFALGVVGMLTGWAIGFGLIQGLASIEFDIEGMISSQGFPLDFGFYQYAVGGVFALTAAVVAAWVPAHRAAQVRPVEIIRGAA